MLLLPTKSSSVTRIFSFGGGVQSTAVMVLQAQRLIMPYDAYIFANVGNDSENPDTLEYIEKYTKPFADKHGIQFEEVQKVRRGGAKDTLVGFIERTERSIPIPARMSNGAPGNRTCTTDFKILVVDKWVKQHSFTHAIVGLGISIDEFSRMRGEEWTDRQGKRKHGFWKRREHPLIDLRISRHKCVEIIVKAGLPVPPKSSCFFCPFTRRAEWIEMKRETPALFDEAVRIEHIINAKRGLLEKDRVYLHADVVPLENAVGNQLTLWAHAAKAAGYTGSAFDNETNVLKPITEDEACEAGYCLT